MVRKANLPEIISCCEKRFQRGAAEGWKHSDFGDLSQEIRRYTGTVISANTLKRIFGKITVDDDYLPQQATIDALAGYAAQCLSEEAVAAAAPQGLSAVSVTAPSDGGKHHKRFRYRGILIAAVLAGGVIYKVITARGTQAAIIRHISTEGVLPASAFFEMVVPDTEDSVFADFGDKSRLQYVPSGKSKLAHNYLFPGVFNVLLISKGVAVAGTSVAVHSRSWIGLGFRRQRDLPEHYYAFPAGKEGADSLFGITNKQLQQVGLDTTGSLFTRLCNYSPLDYQSDNFVFDATFRNQMPEKGIYCTNVTFQISGMQGKIRFKLASPGCSAWVTNIISEKTLDGNKTDLSRFAADLNTWNSVKLINNNRHVQFYVNDRLLFEEDYRTAIGTVKGVYIEFAGSGFVKTCSLRALNGNTLYQF